MRLMLRFIINLNLLYNHVYEHVFIDNQDGGFFTKNS